MRYGRFKHVSICLVLLIQAFLFQGCYSFSGGSVPPHMKTVAVPVFQDQSRAGIARFRAELTRKLTEKIESQSPLRLTPSRVTADALLEGTILSFSDEPSQLSSSTERALTNRVTITVQATFQDRVKKSILFERTFAGFADYTAGSFSSQQDAISLSLDMIAADILDAVVSDWR